MVRLPLCYALLGLIVLTYVVSRFMLQDEAAVFVREEADENCLMGRVRQAKSLRHIAVLFVHLPKSEHRRIVVS